MERDRIPFRCGKLNAESGSLIVIYSSIKAINKTSIKPYMILNTSSDLILTPIITSEMFLFAVTYLLLVCWE
jgi:hypothetical protein